MPCASFRVKVLTNLQRSSFPKGVMISARDRLEYLEHEIVALITATDSLFKEREVLMEEIRSNVTSPFFLERDTPVNNDSLKQPEVRNLCSLESAVTFLSSLRRRVTRPGDTFAPHANRK